MDIDTWNGTEKRHGIIYLMVGRFSLVMFLCFVVP